MSLGLIPLGEFEAAGDLTTAANIRDEQTESHAAVVEVVQPAVAAAVADDDTVVLATAAAVDAEVSARDLVEGSDPRLSQLPQVEDHEDVAAVWRDPATWRVSQRIRSDGTLEAIGLGGGGGAAGRQVALYDDFSGRPDETATTRWWGPFLGTTMTGQKWGLRIGDLEHGNPRIEDGVLRSDATCYFEAATGRPITRMGAEFEWDDYGGTITNPLTTNRGTFAIIPWGDQGSVNGDHMTPRKWGRTACHFRFNSVNFSLDYQDDPPAVAAEAVRNLESGTPWAAPLSPGVRAWIEIQIDREAGRVTVISSWAGTYYMDHPEVTWYDDPVYGPANERYACWEPFTEPDKTTPIIYKVWADHGPQNPAHAGIPEGWWSA